VVSGLSVPAHNFIVIVQHTFPVWSDADASRGTIYGGDDQRNEGCSLSTPDTVSEVESAEQISYPETHIGGFFNGKFPSRHSVKFF